MGAKECLVRLENCKVYLENSPPSVSFFHFKLSIQRRRQTTMELRNMALSVLTPMRNAQFTIARSTALPDAASSSVTGRMLKAMGRHTIRSITMLFLMMS